MRNNFGTFHKFILAFFLLIFVAGCGYKSPPFWPDKKNAQTNEHNASHTSDNIATGTDMSEYFGVHDREKRKEK